MDKNLSVLQMINTLFVIIIICLAIGACEIKTNEKITEADKPIRPTPEKIQKELEDHGSKIRLVKEKSENQLLVEVKVASYKTGAALDVCKGLEKLKEMKLDYKNYEITGLTKFVDRYGNLQEEVAVVNATFSKETVNRINYTNILKRTIFEFADKVTIDPILR